MECHTRLSCNSRNRSGSSSKNNRKEKTRRKKKKDEDQAHYILQISPTDTIKVNTKEQGSFTATAWKMDKNGVVSRANNASITIVPPSGVPGLSIVPISGMGSVNVSVSINQPTNVNNAKVQVNASMGGGGTTAFVTVNFEVTMQVGFE